jgi:phosphatidate cytidylyltransferase|tara:strand:- start:14801 stop:15610 length:810 start_codon:yes stop_codon:yes gene_type:complete
VLIQRVVTALILAPIVIAGIFLLSDGFFAVFVGLFIVVGGWEFANLCGLASVQRVLYAGLILLVMVSAYYFLSSGLLLWIGLVWWCIAFVLVVSYPRGVKLWGRVWQRSCIGFVILVPAWISLIQLKTYENSTFLILVLMFLIWGADVGAYFAGRAFGQKKLAPRVSPGKSWAGVYGGLASAAVVVLLAIWWENSMLSGSQWVMFFFLCMLIVVVSVLGDLTESMFKRHRGVKDSSGLLPGHGGILDRIDSLLAAGPVYALSLTLIGWK